MRPGWPSCPRARFPRIRDESTTCTTTRSCSRCRLRTTSYLKNRLYLGAEAYYLSSDLVKRQRVNHTYRYIGGYAQVGYFVTPKLQPALRWDFMDRNSTDTDGFLNMPAVGLNYYIMGYNLKLQAMYQFLGRWGHATQDARELDDLGLAQHSATVMLQFSF